MKIGRKRGCWDESKIGRKKDREKQGQMEIDKNRESKDSEVKN